MAKTSPARLMKSEKYSLTDNEKLIMFYRENPCMAAKDLLGFDLIWLQRIALEDMWEKRFTCSNISRGVGKSFLFALYGVLKGMLYSNMQIGIVTPVYRQVRRYIFGEIVKWHKQCPYFRNAVDGRVHVGTDACYVHFKNGSFVEGLPVTNEGDNIRGRRYHNLLVDEYAQHSQEALKRSVRPMLNIKVQGRKNQYHIASTPLPKHNHFWPQYLHHIRKCIENPNDYALLEFDYRDVNMTRPSKLCPIVPYEVDEEIIAMQKADMHDNDFAMENLARFPDESTGFFSAKLIDSASPARGAHIAEIETTGNVNGEYYIGVDVARVVDGANFACSIGRRELGRLKLVNMVTLNGGTYQEMNKIIRTICIDFNVYGIAIGQGGGGLTMKDLLAENYVDARTGKMHPPLTDPLDERHMAISNGIPIVNMVNETLPLNNFMYATLKSDMEHGRFIMPATFIIDRDLSKEEERIFNEIKKTKTEFLVIEAVPTSTGFKFTVPDLYQKDRATACILMNYLVTEKNKVPEKPYIELGEGLWVTT